MSNQSGDMKVVKIEPSDSSSLDSAITVKAEPACFDDVYSLEEETIVKTEIDIEPLVIRPPDFVYMPQPCKQEPVEDTSTGHAAHPRMPISTQSYTRTLSTKQEKPVSGASRTYRITHAGALGVRKLEGPQKCNICRKTFALKENYTSHMNTHIRELTPPGDGYLLKPQDDSANDKSVSTVSDQADASTASEDDKDSRSHRQDTANKYFKHTNQLEIKKMVNIGEKSYICDICDKCFRRRDYLITHLNIHTDNQEFKCDTCNKRFKISAHLRRHITTHTSELPYECQVCKKRYKCHGYLKNHAKRHTTEKPYHCELCNRRFFTNGEFILHTRHHTGDLPYKCDVCNRGFATSYRLKYHEKTHTGKHMNSPMHYFCKVCNKRCLNYFMLEQHIRTTH